MKKGHKLDFCKLQENLKHCLEHRGFIAGKDAVLVIGNTGSGKSTLINYLQGCQYENLDGDCTLLSGNEQTKVGNEGLSETSAPLLLQNQQYNLNLLDLPGFMDNRSQEEQSAILYALYAVLAYLKSIKGIILVLDHSDFDSLRGQPFSNLIELVNQLLPIKLFSLLEHNFRYVVTKSKATSLSKIMDKIDKAIKTQEKLIQIEPERKQIYEGIIQFLKGIKANTSNVLIGDVFDHGQTRNQLLTELSEMKSVETCVLADCEGDYRQSLNELSCLIAENLEKILSERNKLLRKIQSNQTEINECETSLPFYQQQILIHLNQDGNRETQNLHERIQNSKQMLKKITDEIKFAEENHDKLYMEIPAYEEEYKQATSDEEISFWREVCEMKNHNWKKATLGLGISLLIVARHHFRYEGPQYSKVEKWSTNDVGTFGDEIQSECKTKYSIFYYMPITVNNVKEVGVEVFVKRKSIPANITLAVKLTKRIQENNEQMNKLRTKIKKKSNELKEIGLEEVIQSLEERKTFTKLERDRVLKSLEDAKQHAEETITRLTEEEKNLRERTFLAEKRCYEVTEFCEIFSEILQLTKISHPIIGLFLESHKEYRAKNLKHSKVIQINDIECPISLNICREPAIVNCCKKAFEYKNIVQVANTTKKCPNCRQPLVIKDIQLNRTLKATVEAVKEINSNENGGLANYILQHSKKKIANNETLISMDQEIQKQMKELLALFLSYNKVEQEISKN